MDAAVVGTAFSTLFWEASIVLGSIGMMELGIGKNDPKDFGYVFLTGGLMETISMVFMIAQGDAFGATAAAAFIFLLWAIGIALVTGTNRMLFNFALWWTGVYFIFAGIFTFQHHLVWLTALFWILTIDTVLLAIRGYGGERTWANGLAKLIGIFCSATAIILFVMAFAGAIGYQLP